MNASVLDASALLAWIRDEDGANEVEPLLTDAIMCAVNWSEVAQKLIQYGADARATMDRLRALGVRVEPFTTRDAMTTAELWEDTRSKGLSLGDRACLALGERLDLPVITADRSWTEIPELADLGLLVRSIR